MFHVPGPLHSSYRLKHLVVAIAVLVFVLLVVLAVLVIAPVQLVLLEQPLPPTPPLGWWGPKSAEILAKCTKFRTWARSHAQASPVTQLLPSFGVSEIVSTCVNSFLVNQALLEVEGAISTHGSTMFVLIIDCAQFRTMTLIWDKEAS